MTEGSDPGYSTSKPVPAITLDAGSATVTVVPRPLSLSIWSEPPCSSASLRASGSPRPVPSCFTGQSGIDLTKGFKGDFDLVRLYPQSGVAHFERDTAVCGVAAVTSTDPPGPANLMAFEIRLSKICLSRVGSATRGGK